MLIFEMRLWSTNYPHNTDSGAEFYGTKGQMYLSRRGRIEVRNDRNAPVEALVKNEPGHQRSRKTLKGQQKGCCASTGSREADEQQNGADHATCRDRTGKPWKV